MKCPYCDHSHLKVTDSRDSLDINGVRRRRECLQCFKRFTTFETIDLTIQVRKKDDTYEDFQQEKLIRGLDAACKYTKISHEQVLALAYKITTDLMELQMREISTTQIGEIVMQKLKELDIIAYIRFACVYRRFKDVKELMEAINQAPSKDNFS
ncbi:MAG: transcriptional regulator NrdR [Rhabdochlamydiaceae bacterium]